MIRPRRTPPGSGQFAGRQDPQAPDIMPMSELIGSTMDTGGLGVALTTASNRRFTGGDLTPQLFLAPPAYPNDRAGLETAATNGVGNYRKALNRQRGRLAV